MRVAVARCDFTLRSQGAQITHVSHLGPLSRHGFKDGLHGAAGGHDEWVAAVGVDLFDFEFRVFAVGGHGDGAATGVDFFGRALGLFGGEVEEFLHHPLDVVKGVLVVVEDHDVPLGGLAGG